MAALRYQLMSVQCATCIFGDRPAVGPERLAEIQTYLITGKTHLCHHADIEQADKAARKRVKMACRGARDWQLQIWHRMGILPEPTDAALAAAMAARG